MQGLSMRGLSMLNKGNIKKKNKVSIQPSPYNSMPFSPNENELGRIVKSRPSRSPKRTTNPPKSGNSSSPPKRPDSPTVIKKILPSIKIPETPITPLEKIMESPVVRISTPPVVITSPPVVRISTPPNVRTTTPPRNIRTIDSPLTMTPNISRTSSPFENLRKIEIEPDREINRKHNINKKINIDSPILRPNAFHIDKENKSNGGSPISIEYTDSSSDSSKKMSHKTVQTLVDIPNFKRITIKDVNKYIEEMYTQEETVLSTSLDILALYLKSQKILYTEAKVYCEQQLNYLMLPAILISAFCTVLSLALSNNPTGPILISCLTASNSFLLALISYLKLDAKAEAHKTSAYQFDKLQTISEFNSGKVMFFHPDNVNLPEDHVENENTVIKVVPTTPNVMQTSPQETEENRPKDDNSDNKEIMKKPKRMIEDVIKLVYDIETKVNEIKEMNKFILPEKIRHNYNNTYNQNIFSSIKKVQTQEILLRTQLQNKINQINETIVYYDYNYHNSDLLDLTTSRKKWLDEKRETILAIKKERDAILEEIIKLRDTYIEQDINIKEELKHNKTKKRWNCCQWLKT